MAENINQFFMNYLLTSLLRKIEVPGSYHERVRTIKTMLEDDVSGLIDVLMDFSIESATVNYRIETDNPNLTEILNNWLEKINFDIPEVPTGINAVAEEYFKERWKSSSFPILKISKWEDTGNNLIVPSRMFIVDGESIHAQSKSDSDIIRVSNYNYYLGNTDGAEKLGKNCIITKPFGRWFDKYPTPYLIKRGCYHNWKIISSLKDKESALLDQVIPYLLSIKKGTDNLATNLNVHYNDDQLKEVLSDFQKLISDYEELSSRKKALARATNFDEKIEHLIPDLGAMFDNKLFEVAEKNILSGLGFIDIAEAVTASRRDSVLNPKPFIQETRKGVTDFKTILKELAFKIIEENKSKHKKWANVNVRIVSSPILGFMTDKFKERIRQCWDRGKISNQTAIEVIAEVDFETEVKRREQESKDGIDLTMYPNITENKEGISIDVPGEELSNSPDKKEVEKDEIPDSKKGNEKQNFKSMKNFDIYTEDLEVSTYNPVITENYVRFRQLDPKKIQNDSFRTLTISERKGIKVIYGRQEGEEKDSIQSYLFAKEKWDEKKGKEWIEKHNTKVIELVGAPYKTIKQLPSKVSENMSIDLSRNWLKIFNKAYNVYDNETLAFRVAWSAIRKIAKQKNGKWIRKAIKKDNNKKPASAKITKEILYEAMEQSEKDCIDEVFNFKKLQTDEKKKSLFQKLLGNK